MSHLYFLYDTTIPIEQRSKTILEDKTITRRQLLEEAGLHVLRQYIGTRIRYRPLDELFSIVLSWKDDEWAPDRLTLDQMEAWLEKLDELITKIHDQLIPAPENRPQETHNEKRHALLEVIDHLKILMTCHLHTILHEIF